MSDMALDDGAIALLIFLASLLLDYLLGDPWHWLHPVQVMGWVISAYTETALRLTQSPPLLRLLGVGLTLLMLLGSGGVAWGMIALGGWIHPGLAGAIAIVLFASCLAGRSLRQAAEDVLAPVLQGDIEGARQRLKNYVGRDTEDLSESEILRAVLETVAENTVDGGTAPLFYGIVGSIVSPGGAAVVALAYKSVSTLDSMIGYKRSPYRDIGWCSARTEDVLTWLPCRLTVLTIALLSGHPRRLWGQCHEQGQLDPSPNSGWSECAYAMALGVQLGGENRYQGVVTEKPRLGKPDREITASVVQEALGLTRRLLVWGALIGVWWIWAHYRFG
ncbi:adenosylcobinamide-phosphate synthase CbiB [Phormidium yuhuli AB48]|uniref:Cobalamin biosynthesis protein CobD n=1 Tax=Phormidium yuhuli AB48 TaxID=2940671 RepID=A0ABY5AML1_9CYAN|nr:adenosylcobinamide-phosphate synthase CbiB [Phormidium yuhuli]USR90067.1 adenosylcobinamide-phosphate synthase CbiB [Phormidium yuhuli AB48]